ncbi:MAG TPA: serine acetyltransferase [Kiritimatiellia bacterium]|nr:serine acetyltransferase [Kiritimatiellia bacterium]
MKTWQELRETLHADRLRYSRTASGWRVFRTAPGFRYTVIWRWNQYLRGRGLLRLLLGAPSAWAYGHYTYKFGISIPLETGIGPGLYIGHFGCIHLNEHVVMGANCNLNQGVTIGKHNRGERKGCPVIGDGVYFGPGAKVFGGIRIGNDVAIGANAVVTRDLPDHAVAVGAPARVISHQGATGYIRDPEGATA